IESPAKENAGTRADSTGGDEGKDSSGDTLAKQAGVAASEPAKRRDVPIGAGTELPVRQVQPFFDWSDPLFSKEASHLNRERNKGRAEDQPEQTRKEPARKSEARSAVKRRVRGFLLERCLAQPSRVHFAPRPLLTDCEAPSQARQRRSRSVRRPGVHIQGVGAGVGRATSAGSGV